MKLTKRNKIIAEFIPVFLLIGYYLFPFQFLKFTQTVLGKTVLLVIIIFYAAFVDKLIGAAAALIFIFYYQTDYVEGFYSEFDAKDVTQPPTIENFEPSSEDLYDNITNNKITTEADLVIPKQSNNIVILKPTDENKTINIIGTSGVISEAFTTF